ncbi:MarR family winged helix-turn-helix transcriptional regulator [Paenibacillus hunanensis]|uniref:DNA-binding MarR family transcriptional regulator n=1 Tax=Paenibacillus hunanensis TaxID=539262 RepID=A0ABU1J0W1_9BACL|nr:MarR family transcriptional regulator [Paenibacillus hunanensis]MCL9661893.1 MarR family transcriptional regulator [Paenibacillus hunanensis]MDR6244257.1 DNA-binding MarR family transcriptional regulator [Paenibacillus hunanensis]GGJ18217.1 transcriptional regulator [Paenibacillus hunanensis]
MSTSTTDEVFNQIQSLQRQLACTFEKCAGISASRLQLLCQLSHTEEISQSSLQKLVGIDHAAITRHLKQLEAEQVVVRRNNPDDNRITLVQLTDLGRERIIAFREEREQFVARMFHGFNAGEQEQLLDMLQRLNANISGAMKL